MISDQVIVAQLITHHIVMDQIVVITTVNAIIYSQKLKSQFNHGFEGRI